MKNTAKYNLPSKTWQKYFDNIFYYVNIYITIVIVFSKYFNNSIIAF